MEEYVEVDDFYSGRLESIVIDSNGREWKINVDSSQGYPPTYVAHVNMTKVPGGPFDEKEKAHKAALNYVEKHSTGLTG